MFTVKQISKLAGVTPRTLHHYDDRAAQTVPCGRSQLAEFMREAVKVYVEKSRKL